MAAQSFRYVGGMASAVAQDYKKEPLKATDFLRYPNYHQALQQKIASTGASSYLEVDAAQRPLYVSANLAALSIQSNEQNTRYNTHMELQMEEAMALATYNNWFNQNQMAGNNAQNLANWQGVVDVQQKMQVLGYNAGLEDQRQRYLSDGLQRASKDLQQMQKAVGTVFEWILATVDATLGNRVIALQARTGPGFSPNSNLIASISMLTREMAGNTHGSREALWEMINRIRPATTVAGFRFLLDAICSVWTVITSSIALHGGNGLLTNSQIHHKLLSKMASNSAELVWIRYRVNHLPDTTPILEIRDQLKVDLDRETQVDSTSGQQSSGARQAHYAVPNAANVSESGRDDRRLQPGVG